ncbi:MAG: hypothetical protein AAFO81_00695 [Pseudomonadota bacterium]
MTTRIASLLLAAWILMSLSVAHAQTAEEGATEQETADDKVIDEIEVLGQQTPLQLSKVVVQARLDFWDVFNSLNRVDDYQVVCRKVAQTGTRFKKMRCAPKYFTDALAEVTQQQFLINGAGGPPPDERTAIMMTRKKKAEADAYMIGLIESNPLLLERYETLLKASKAYEQSVLRE